MKRLLLLIIVLGSLAVNAQKIADMPAITTTSGTDILIVEDATATNHMTITNLFGTVPVNIAAAGEITGKTMVVLVTAATWAITDLDSAQNVVYINDDANVIDFTLPGAVKGLVVMFYDLGGAVITIDPFDGTDTIYLNGATVGAGDAIDSPGAVGDFICLVALDATRWITTGRAGVWVDGGVD